MKKKILSTLLTCAMVTTLFYGCGKAGSTPPDTTTPDKSVSSIDGLIENGKIYIAVDDSQAPVCYRDEATNELVGFDIDCMTAVGDYLGLDVEFVPTSFDSLIIGLTSQKYDLACAAIYVTEARAQQIDFADSYYSMDEVICVSKNNSEITSSKDLPGKLVGVQSGAASIDSLNSIDGFDSADIREFSRVPDALLDINSGRIDCVVTESLFAAYYGKDLNVYYDEPLDSYPTAICVNKNCPEVLSKTNEAIAKLVEDGTFAEYSEKWFGRDIINYQK